METTKALSSKMDMLHGPIWNKIIQYALPVAATGILEQLFNASDLAISGILNVLLNLFFVIVLNMTVNGVAIATVISNLISSILLFIKLIRTKQVIRVQKHEFRFDFKVFKKIMQIGLPAGIQTAVFAISNIVIQAAINSLGTTISAAFNIEIFAYDVFNSFSQACTTFTGQNYGARQLKRCKKVLLLCIIEDFIAPAILTIIGVCGVRILWIFTVFPSHKTFWTIMTAYPLSLSITAVLIFIALMIYRPSHKLLV